MAQTFERTAICTLTLKLENGDAIETTPEHPFYVQGKGWVPAGELGIGTSIVTRAGPSRVLSTQISDENKTVYNFEVEGTHSYFVGSNALWVHNYNYHHWFPQAGEFTEQWNRLGIDIHDYTTKLPTNFHQNVIHAGKKAGEYGPGGKYNAQWRAFFESNPQATTQDAFKYMLELRKYWGASHLPLVRYPLVDRNGISILRGIRNRLLR